MKKDFETLEKIAIHMASTVWTFEHKEKVEKLIEEFDELILELIQPEIADNSGFNNEKRIIQKQKVFEDCEINVKKVKDELADVLFVMLQISHNLGFNASDLIHHATNKLYNRIADPCYNRD